MAMKVRYTTFDGEIVSENRGGVVRDYVPDPLGSTVALLDSTQTQTDTFSYWPYGENRTHTGTNPTKLQYGGTLGYYQQNVDQTYVRARVLDVRNGLWLTEDPISYSGGWNIYRYAANMPVSVVDPSGTGPQDYPGWDKNCRKWNGSGWHSCSSPQWGACLAKCGAGNVDHCCSNGNKWGGPISGSGFDCQCIKPAAPPPKMPSCNCGCGGQGGPSCTCQSPVKPPPWGSGPRPGIPTLPAGPGQGCVYICTWCTFSWRTGYANYTGCTKTTTSPANCPPTLPNLTIWGPCLTGIPIYWN